jgi:hypothetical protein
MPVHAAVRASSEPRRHEEHETIIPTIHRVASHALGTSLSLLLVTPLIIFLVPGNGVATTTLSIVQLKSIITVVWCLPSLLGVVRSQPHFGHVVCGTQVVSTKGRGGRIMIPSTMFMSVIRVLLLSPFFLSHVLECCCWMEEDDDYEEKKLIGWWFVMSLCWSVSNAMMVIVTKESQHFIDMFLSQQVVIKTTRIGL